ncbi:TylF/MycF/NovP-related O-methyltransferase [Helicobacter rodentium]|uniref:TylF/MycF/NovP-related O-methyltransferase n=1 Tax=Helicobacter rodentium TaxID=59617 RepID=UPI0026028F3C|nr:TylF/MycF/NovP-related O-methyltransferase [Helicobacter rodentium]
MEKIVIFGAATGGKSVANKLLIGGGQNKILFFVDNDPKKHGRTLLIQDKKYEVKSPDTLLTTEFDRVIIGSVCGEDILRQLQEELKIPYSKIDDFLIRNYHQTLETFLSDFVSICKTYNIKGNVAELGVYQGDTAKVMNRIFEDRKLFLFDTFEGYNAKDINAEKDLEAVNFGEKHLDNTSLELVMKKMPNPDNVIVKKGWFPETTKGLENEQFCFVDIDVDLYAPTLAGLEFFYPKLTQGGIIMLSYFAPHIGNKQAVEEFQKRHNFQIVPLGIPNRAAIIKLD